MSEHTPGPWKSEDRFIFAGSEFKLYVIDEAESEANARLIAAAPDLLEALQCALDHLEYCGYGDSWERECALTGEDPLDKKIEAAIAKATGVTNAD